MLRSFFALLAPIVAASPVGAQDGLNMFMFEKSYGWALFAPATPTVLDSPPYYAAVAEPNLFAEASLAQHIAVWRGFDAEKIEDVLVPRRYGFQVLLTPRFHLRALDLPGKPIREVSFMPKMTAQWLRFRGTPLNRGAARGGAPQSEARRAQGFYGVLGHHSNGGSGCEFVDQTFTNNNGCVDGVPAGTSAANREVQVIEGNFSDSYFELGGVLRRGALEMRSLSVGADPETRWTWFVEAAVGVQRHVFADPGFLDLYGRWRGRLDLKFYKEMFPKIGLTVSARVDAWSPDADRFANARNYTGYVDAQIQGINVRFRQVGFGFRYVRGMDYFNTQYVRDISHFHWMITFDAWSPCLSSQSRC